MCLSIARREPDLRQMPDAPNHRRRCDAAEDRGDVGKEWKKLRGKRKQKRLAPGCSAARRTGETVFINIGHAMRVIF